MDEYWSRKDLRDARAKELQAQGYMVKWYSTGPAQIHPMYVEDLKETALGQDRGFGNTVYKTSFATLYGVKTL